MNKKKLVDLEKQADKIRKHIVTMAYEAQGAHLGGSLSAVDILTVLYFSAMKVFPSSPSNPRRDRFVFSKAHDCKVLYATLAEKGFFKKEILKTYEKDGGLPGHSTRFSVPGVEISAGSLGHGLSIAVGMAYSGKISKKNYKVFALLSDGECDEGSTWEAVLFAGHHKLNKLVAIVDYNKFQAYGKTDEILTLEPFVDKWRSFGWNAKEVNGHNISELEKALTQKLNKNNKPTVIIAHTIKGYKGIPKYVNQLASHYKPPTQEEMEAYLSQLK